MQADRACESLVDLLRDGLPVGVEVFPGPPAEDQPLDECVWIDADESDYEFRSLGHLPSNRTETIQIDLMVAVYREAEDQTQAQAAARTRASELERLVEEQIVGGTLDLGGVVTFCLVSHSQRSYVAAGGGWSRRIAMRITATNYPRT